MNIFLNMIQVVFLRVSCSAEKFPNDPIWALALGREMGPHRGRQKLWGLFLESPKTFQAHFGWHNSLCIFKTKASRGTKLCSYFNFYFAIQHMNRPALQSKQVGVSRMAFQALKVFGTFENGPLATLGFKPTTFRFWSPLLYQLSCKARMGAGHGY